MEAPRRPATCRPQTTRTSFPAPKPFFRWERWTLKKGHAWRGGLAARRALGPAHARGASAVAGELPSPQRDGDQGGRIELVHESPQRERASQRAVPRGDQLVDLQLPGQVARPVP